MTTLSLRIGIALWISVTTCFGQVAGEWKSGEWKKIRAQKLNNCATSLQIQRMTTYKREEIYWVAVSIIAPKKSTKIKYQDIQFTALDTNGAPMDSRPSDPPEEKKSDYEEGLDTERLGFYHIPYIDRKLGAIKMVWHGSTAIFRMSDAMYFPK